jgi:hypothetical protein
LLEVSGPEAPTTLESTCPKPRAYIEELGKYLRVVTLEDGETVHNAFPDRDFVPPSE